MMAAPPAPPAPPGVLHVARAFAACVASASAWRDARAVRLHGR